MQYISVNKLKKHIAVIFNFIDFVWKMNNSSKYLKTLIRILHSLEFSKYLIINDKKLLTIIQTTVTDFNVSNLKLRKFYTFRYRNKHLLASEYNVRVNYINKLSVFFQNIHLLYKNNYNIFSNQPV